MKSKSPDLKLIAEPQAYFRDLIVQAMEQERVEIQPETELYLVNLLKQFISTDNLFVRTGDGQVVDQPLTFKLKEAIEEETPRTKSLLFRHLGDFSLYVAGYFQESLSRKLVDVDYYIDVGVTAYQQVAVTVEEKPLQNMYRELGIKFPNLVDVLGVVSMQTRTPSNETELLKVVESWKRTGSENARKLIEQAGIDPNATELAGVKKKWQ